MLFFCPHLPRTNRSWLVNSCPKKNSCESSYPEQNLIVKVRMVVNNCEACNVLSAAGTTAAPFFTYEQVL